MLSEKIVNYLKDEPQLLAENKEIYRSALKKNGFDEKSEFVEFATTYGTEFNGSEGFMFNVVRDLLDDSSTGVNYNMHNKQNVPLNLISLLDDTTYAFLLYNKEDGSVILVEDGNVEKVIKGNYDKKWNSFNEFLEEFFEIA
ncbi:hypothetical protein EG347_14685 [Chryseobacterium sp. G0186]|uniref:hypothetical protein n=1 Tax=Chryseobacterium sp. G0186 TaxID=2487064 RepID=UPI000F4E8C91|nr:hypothetical protein [Chryseobacterium sp. G0186]AZA78665.1 hypothetical protein EG347_14685 [Chryseobacterium sp. G0186]